jgi:hypothetical protein
MPPGGGTSPIHEWYMGGHGDLSVKRHHLRAQSVGTPTDRGKGTGASSTPKGVKGPKSAAVVVWCLTVLPRHSHRHGGYMQLWVR